MRNKHINELIRRITALGFMAYIEEASDEELAVFVSAEEGDDAADFYGEYRGGYPWINPKLEELAQEGSGRWEWVNPGCIGIYDWKS